MRPRALATAELLWGKVRRFGYATILRRRAAQHIARRRGDCTRCGACCKFVFRCPAYDDSDGVPKCTIYNSRPGACRLFPVNEKDLRDVRIASPGDECGFFFIRGDDGRWTTVEADLPGPRPTGALHILWRAVQRRTSRILSALAR